ncbi:MAG TPA: 3'(2'),5'-bisphosphate nucleotidase [Gammaproteobacteria bacterium]|nr:3'(2'),5'-bisphosphate nucleotidase [Gammaproteobacteria bacterium]
MTHTTMNINHCHYLDRISTTARQAGAAIMQIYERDFDVQHKGDGSPLTEADLAAHHLICRQLADMSPDLPILSEESRDIPYEERSGWQRYWLVDPLDGTKEFVNRNGEFTVNIALIENGKPVLGVVYAPVMDILYTGCDGVATMQVEDGPSEEISVKPFSGDNPCLVASRSHAGEALTAAIERLCDRFDDIDILSMGSSFKLCLVAEGRADLYPRLGLTSEWDTAAAHAIVTAAGGRVTTLNGENLCYNKENLLNPWFLVSNGQYDWLSIINEPDR